MHVPGNIVLTVLWMLGGLGLFLYGIDMMGRSLRKAAGSALRKGLNFLTRTRIHGLITGTLVTGLLQSSSASTVMVVGFISAGLMTFSQSIGLILGANIGTTLTPQITALDIDDLALPLLGVGFLINFLSRRRVVRKLGLACMGFGMLFFGLVIMKFAVSGYTLEIRGWLEGCTNGGLKGQLLAFLIAVAVTSIVQSSAATIAMLQALAVEGALKNIDLTIPIIIGAHVGTCVTAILASLKAPRSAKRAAVAHLFFNLMGTLITICFYRLYVTYIPRTADSLQHQIANCHLAIKLVNVCLFLPFTTLFARFIMFIMPGDDKCSAAPEFLEYRDLDNVPKALENVKKEIRRMCNTCLDITRDSVAAFFSRDEVVQEMVIKQEDLMDDLYGSIADYVVQVSERDLPVELAIVPPQMMHILSDVERIGDHAENIVELSQAFSGSRARLSSTAKDEIESILTHVMEIGHETLLLFDNAEKERVNRILELRRDLKVRGHEIIHRHEERLARGECTVMAGMAFIGLITNLHRVANHLKNVATNMVGYPEQSVPADI